MIPPKPLESPVDESLLPPSPGDKIVGNKDVVQPDDSLIASIRAEPDDKAILPPLGFDNPGIYCYRNALLTVLLCSDRLMSYIQHHHLPRIQEYQYGDMPEDKSFLPMDYQDIFTMIHRLFQSYWSSSRDQNSVDAAMRQFWKYIDSPACQLDGTSPWPMGSQEDPSELLNFLMLALHLQLGERGADTSAVQFPEVQNVQHVMYSATQVLKRCSGCRLSENVKHAMRNDDSLCWQVPVLATGMLGLEDLVFLDYDKGVSKSPWYCSDCYTSWEENEKPNYIPGTPAWKEMIARRSAKSKSDYEWHIIGRLPEVLLMQLKIFNSNLRSNKLKAQIRLLQELDMAAFVNRDVYKGSTRFQLKGVVRHIGTDMQFGHYVNEVMVADEWYHINDRRVRKTNWLDINDLRRQKGRSPETPYMLLWEKVPDFEAEEEPPQTKPAISTSQGSPISSSLTDISSSECSFSPDPTRQRSKSQPVDDQGVASRLDSDSNDPDEDVSDNTGSTDDGSNDDGSNNGRSGDESSDDESSNSDSSLGSDPDATPANTIFVADAGTQTVSKLHDAPAAIRSSIKFDGQSLLEIHSIPNLPDLMERICAAPEGGEISLNAIDVEHRGRLEVFQMEDGHLPVSFQLWRVLQRGFLHWEDIIDKEDFGKKQKKAWYNFYNNVQTSYGPGIHPIEMIPKWQWKRKEEARRTNEYWARIDRENNAEQRKGKCKDKEARVRRISIFQTPMMQWVPAINSATSVPQNPKSPPRKHTLKRTYQDAFAQNPRPEYATRHTSPKTPSPKPLRPVHKHEQTRVRPADTDVSDGDHSSSSYITALSPAKPKPKPKPKSPSPRHSRISPGMSSSSLSSPPDSPPDSAAPKSRRRGRPPKPAIQPKRAMPARATKPKQPGLVNETVKKGVAKKTALQKPAAGKKTATKPTAGGKKGVGKKPAVKKAPVAELGDEGKSDAESAITKKATRKRKSRDTEEEREGEEEKNVVGGEGKGRGGRKRLKKSEDGTWSRI